MKADIFFAQNASKASECHYAPVVEARKVMAGERIIISAGINIATTADEDGWQIETDHTYEFMSDADFSKNYMQVTITGTKELPEGAKVDPVKKGQEIFTQPWSDTILGVHGKASVDGFIVRLPENDNKARFMSDSAFRAAFKTSADPQTKKDQGLFRYIPQESDEPARYVLIEQETVFDFKQETYMAAAGSVLVENPGDEDGYTLYPADHFAQNFIVSKAASGPTQNPRPSLP